MSSEIKVKAPMPIYNLVLGVAHDHFHNTGQPCSLKKRMYKGVGDRR